MRAMQLFSPRSLLEISSVVRLGLFSTAVHSPAPSLSLMCMWLITRVFKVQLLCRWAHGEHKGVEPLLYTRGMLLRWT